MYLAENMKLLRKKKNWSQADLARKIGAHLTHINRIETGKYNPSLGTVVALAHAFEMPIDQLVLNSDGVFEEIKIEDQPLAQRMKLLNSLTEEDRQVVVKVIDAMLTKKKMLDLLIHKDAVLAH